MKWYVDKGLAQFNAQMRKRYPGIVIGTIGDENHRPPSQHIPEADGSVDASDYMIGAKFPPREAARVFRTLRANRDRRILYAIYDRQIFSSVTQPWKLRPYGGDDPHTGHLHLSVNDLHETDGSPWRLESRTVKMINLVGSMPILKFGDDDDDLGHAWVRRVQLLRGIPADGIYGPQTADAVRKLMGAGDGRTVDGTVWAWLLAMQPRIE